MVPADALLKIALYAVAINLAAFLAFAWDKHSARKGMWRVSENNLLLLAFAGGIIGAKTGQRLLRHKTRKQPFRHYLNLIVVMQALAIAALFSPDVRGALSTLLR